MLVQLVIAAITIEPWPIEKVSESMFIGTVVAVDIESVSGTAPGDPLTMFFGSIEDAALLTPFV